MITSKEEVKLIKACTKGHRQAQRQLYDMFSSDMYVVCLRYCKNDEEAQDILQESFVKVFKNISSFRGDSKLYHWIKRIVINTALNQQRNKRYLYPIIDIKENHSVSDDEYAVADFNWKELLKMVMSLPEGCRVIFNLYAIEGYNHREIAKMLDISEGTSKSQYSRARQLLQKRIKNEEKINYGTTG